VADIAGRVQAHAEAILAASGSSLKHYTLPKNRAAILGAVMDYYEEAFRAGADLATETFRAAKTEKEQTDGQ
jgi:hypothetical protein